MTYLEDFQNKKPLRLEPQMSFLLDKNLYQKVVSQFPRNRFLICETLLYVMKAFVSQHFFQSLNPMPAITLPLPSLDTDQI